MRKPKSNIPRGTPGMILLIFATLLLAVALVRTVQSGREPTEDEIQPLTGLGDMNFYESLSENDFYNAALVFDAEPKGIFRRTVNPVSRPDAHMLRHGVESTGRLEVYTKAPSAASGNAQTPNRWFLKSGDHLYIEFGARKFWPAFSDTGK